MKANFNGQEREFNIHPDSVGLFEATLPGGSAYALLRRFTAGEWSANDVAHVLSFALHGPSKEAAQFWRFRRDASRYGLPSPPIPYSPHPDVVAAVAVEGPGNFASLAADILTAAVFKQEPADDATA